MATGVDAGSGEPLGHVLLQLSYPQRDGDDPTTQTTKTDGGGRFDFDEVSAGTWRLEAQTEMYCRQIRDDVVLAEGADAVDVRFDLAPAGMVLVKLDGLPEWGEALRVVLEPLGGVDTQSRDAEAGQSLELPSVPPGSCRLSVQQRDKAGKAEVYSQEITVVAGQTLDVHVP
ncbi:MAG TPA: carboxypeptidase-like regulatory domain-containing protein [Planctomycetota bacterium]|nr:carboxypeptidase-like regulatory domain-containing protein [Planctomycetota bacterium]